MIDTHCHLTDQRLLERLEEVLSNAQVAGVNHMVSIGTHPADWQATLSLARKYANVRCALGIHPNHCHEAELNEVEQLRPLQSEAGVVAMGEMGLDYHHAFSPRARQGEFFSAQLAIAQELDRPVVIHCREAVDDALGVLRTFPRIVSVFHCFTGTKDEAERILDAGHYIGFTGVVTFRNGQALREIAASMPADRILLETDAPYLSPEPMRKQKVNEPALVVHTAAAVAAARGISIEDLDRITTANAKKFYRCDFV